MSRRGWLAAALGVASLGCRDGYAPDLLLNTSANCTRARITPVLGELESSRYPWTRVEAAVLDGGSEPGAWLLTTTQTGDGTRWALDRLDETGASGAHVDLGLDLVPSSLALRPGPEPGEAWLVRRVGTLFELWRVRFRGDALVTASRVDFGAFPPVDELDRCELEPGRGVFGTCPPEAWWRDLAFVRGRPFVVAIVQRGGPEPSHSVYLAELNGNLSYGEPQSFSFERNCDGGSLIGCEQPVRYLRTEILATQQNPYHPTWHAFAARQLTVDGTTVADVELVILTFDFVSRRREPDGAMREIGGISPVLPVERGEARMAVDPAALYLVVDRPEPAPDDLLRLLEGPLRGNRPLLATLPVDLAGGRQLIELESDVALAEIAKSGELWVDKLFPDAPEVSQRSSYAGATPFAALQPAGPGGLLLRPRSGSPELVRVECDGEAPIGEP